MRLPHHRRTARRRRSQPEGPGRTAPVLTAVLALFAAATALASPAPADNGETGGPRPDAARPMRFERLSIEQGLSQSVVNCILQDRTGFLWIGTQAGLNRYDGYGFKVYRHDPDDPASLPHDFILALAEDPAGDLWIGTEGGGLARWRRATDSFDSFRHDPADPASLGGDGVVDFAWDRAGSLWIATFESGLDRLDPATGAFTHFRHDPSDPRSLVDDRVRAVHEDRSGRLWVGTLGGLDLYDPLPEPTAAEPPGSAGFVHHRHRPGDRWSLSDDRVRQLLEDRRGDLWVGTHGGLNRFDPSAGAFERFLHDPKDPASISHDWVRSLLEDRDGRLWVGTDGGLNLLQEATDAARRGRFAAYHPDPADPASLGSDQILALYQDRGGLLWISTVGAGLSKWNPDSWSFSHISSAEGGASNMVFSISEDRRGGLWVGTFGSGLEHIDRGAGRSTRYRHDPADASSLADDRITALLHDRHGTLWVGTLGGGLHRWIVGSGGFEHFRHDPERSDSLSADAVTAIFEDRRGRLWVATHGGGLNLHRGGNSFLRFRHDPDDRTSLGNDRVLSLAEDREGFLWLATDGGGVNRFHPATGAFLRLTHRPGVAGSLSSNEPNVVHVDRSGRLWVGTEGSGLDLLESFDRNTGRAVFRNFSRADGLPDDTIWGIRSDPTGALWLSTNDGLARLDPETGAVHRYSTSHGLQSPEFNMGAHYQSPSGELFFGGLNGLNAFFPDRVRGAADPPTVALTGFTRFNQTVDLGATLADVERLELSYHDHYLAFEFAALDFTAPQDNRFRYRIAGLDDTWVDLGTEHRVTFASLEPGRYTLKVQGSNPDGVWNEEGAEIAIVVAAPLWQRWWAWSFYILGLAALVGGFVRAQQRKLQRQQRIAERERQSAEERRQLLVQRETLIGELEHKNAELERFNYTVSHDLKTPLVTIKNFLGLLKKDAASGNMERLEHDTRRIGAAADRMSRLLDELLELSRLGINAGPPQEVPLVELAREALEAVRGPAVERGVEVVIDPQLPVVFGDRLRLLQLYQNLLANAAHYLGDQRAPRVELGVRHAAAADRGVLGRPEKVLFVCDNGIGIDERYHQKVFGLFERLDAAAEGTGIGLALAKRIVEMHGGRIWVESEGLGRGSTFCFTLADRRSEEDVEASRDGGTVVEAGDRFRQS